MKMSQGTEKNTNVRGESQAPVICWGHGVKCKSDNVDNCLLKIMACWLRSIAFYGLRRKNSGLNSTLSRCPTIRQWMSGLWTKCTIYKHR